MKPSSLRQLGWTEPRVRLTAPKQGTRFSAVAVMASQSAESPVCVWEPLAGTGESSRTCEVSELQLSAVTRRQRGELRCIPHASPHLLAISDRGTVRGEAGLLEQHQVYFLP